MRYSSLVAMKLDIGVVYFTVKCAFVYLLMYFFSKCLLVDVFHWDILSTKEFPYLVWFFDKYLNLYVTLGVIIFILYLVLEGKEFLNTCAPLSKLFGYEDDALTSVAKC